MSSAATYGSATDDPVHPSRESFAPLSNNVHAKKNGETREKFLYLYGNNARVKKARKTKREPFNHTEIMCMQGKTREREKRAGRPITAILAQKKNGEREIGIRYNHISS